jgi:hypothetical protein
MMDTHVVMPPPPIPAKARARIRLSMDVEVPHQRQPRAKIIYAERRHVFRPKMSLNFPYKG